MPIIKCATELVKAAGGLITPEEADILVKEIAARARRGRTNTSAESLTDAMLRVSTEVAQELVVEAKIAKRNELLNMQRFAETSAFVKQSKNKHNALKSLLVGTTEAKAGAGDSVAARQQAHSLRFKVRLFQDLKREGVDTIFTDKKHARSIAKELAELTLPEGTPGISGNIYAQKTAKIVHKWQQDALGRLNSNGAWIRRLPGYVTRTAHDSGKLTRTGFPDWAAKITPLLDDRTFRNVEPGKEGEFLQSVWESLSTGVHFKHADQSVDLSMAFKGPASVAKRLSRERLLHFKNADSWFDYHETFGRENLHEAILSGFEFAGRDLGLLEKLGTAPHSMVDRLKDVALKERRAEAASGNKLAAADVERISKGKDISNMMAELDGSTFVPGSMSAAKVAAGIRNVQSMAKLGNATISSFADVPALASELQYQGKGFLTSYMEPIKGLFQGRSRFEREQLGELILSGSEAMIGSIHSRWNVDDGLPGALSKGMHTYFRLNGQTWWNDVLKSTVTSLMSTDMALSSKISWDGLSVPSKRLFSRAGITELDWRFADDLVGKSSTGRQYLFPEKALDIPDSVVRTKLNKPKMSAATARKFKEELQTKLDAMFIERSDYAIPTPGSAERALMLQGTSPGTLFGEAARFFGQFKSFPVTFLSKVYGRETVGRVTGGLEGFVDGKLGATGFSEGMRHGKGSLAGILQVIIGTTAVGYISMATKDLIKGKEPRDPSDKKTWAAAMAQGGGMGIYGDYLFGEYNRFGRSALSSLVGPTFGQLDDVVEIYQRLRSGEDVQANVFRMIKGNTPFINLPYIKPALDYLLFYQMQENMNPGFLRRMERRMKRENDQEFLWPPSRYSKNIFQ